MADLFRPGAANLVWWETDRTILGGICPATDPLTLEADPAMRATFFLERREAGIINLGGAGVVRGDQHYLDCFRKTDFPGCFWLRHQLFRISFKVHAGHQLYIHYRNFGINGNTSPFRIFQ